MSWIPFKDNPPQKTGLYLITVRVCSYCFLDGKAEFEVEERRYVRQAELWIAASGTRCWSFVDEDFHDIDMEGEYHEIKTDRKITSGKSAVEIIAWREMPKEYEGDI